MEEALVNGCGATALILVIASLVYVWKEQYWNVLSLSLVALFCSVGCVIWTPDKNPAAAIFWGVSIGMFVFVVICLVAAMRS